MLLKEELFDDMTDTAIENLFINTVNKKWDSIADLNSVINTIKSEEYDEYVPVLEDILVDEHNHIGKLQQIIEVITAQSDAIEEGKEEAEELLSEGPVDESFSGIEEPEDFAGWIAFYGGKKLEIPKSDADGIYKAKLIAIEKFKIPKSKLGLLSIYPGFNECLNEDMNIDYAQEIYDWLSDNFETVQDVLKKQQDFKDYVDDLKANASNLTKLTTDINRAIKKFSSERGVKPQKFMSILQESLRNDDNIERNKHLVKQDLVPESLQEDIDENASKFYVSYYEESPAYHAEEGGYFVATCELISSEEFDSLDEARKRIAQLAEEDIMEKISDEFYLDRSKYIGCDRFYIIETEKGSEEKGDTPYQ